MRTLPGCAAITLLLGAMSPPAIAGQAPPDFGGILGAILNSALRDQARREWQNRPIADYSCLEAHNLSADRLTANGIGPNDPRVQRIFAQCAKEAANAAKVTISPDVTASSGSYNPNFVVDGLAAGAAVHPDSPVYKAYKCRPSDQFPGFTWCGIKHPMTGKFGPFDSWVTILHSDANTAVFILQDVIPAYFSPADVEREIQRLSQNFGQAARVLNGDARADAPHSVIAAWGDVTLTPLDESTMDELRRGETITAGLLIDFLGDSRKSAREGLPVFHMGGGSGYIWAAEFDDAGKGRLRITAVNPSLLPPTVAPPPAPPNPVPAPTDEDRTARATAAANQQLDDAAAFIKEHSESPNLLDYVDRITALKSAVKNGDPDEIERKSKELADAFSHDKDYQQHLADLVEAQKKREAQYLLDAIHRGQKERDFILDYIGKNPLADATPALAALVKQLNPALQRADLNQLQPLVDKIDVAIREANLESAFIAAQKEVNNSPEKKIVTPTVIPNTPPAVKLPTTEKNRFLVEGDLDDVEILYNANSKAPHIAQNLRGDFVFSQNEARICLFGQNPDGLALTAKQVVSAKADARQIAVTVEPCNPEHLLSYDIVATQRNAFLRSKRDDALALIQTIEDDDYRKFTEVTAADLKKAAGAEHTQIEKNKANIADGAPDGFGVVLLKTGSANLCLAVEKAEVPSHQQLLLRAEDKLNLEMQTAVVIKDATIDNAFINIQKRQCGGVYASAADLKALTAALARDDIPYTVSSLWNLPADVEREDAALADKGRKAAQEETERRQRNEDLIRLRDQRAKDFSATQAAQQATLRHEFGDSAKAAADTLSSEITTLTRDPGGSIAGFYPAYTAWLTDKLADHWEIMTIDTEVQDFGISSFKSRGLDTIFTRITLHLKNRMLGEYKDACFIFCRINDTEFSMSREPAFAKCDDEAAIVTWQNGHQFKSEWLASN